MPETVNSAARPTLTLATVSVTRWLYSNLKFISNLHLKKHAKKKLFRFAFLGCGRHGNQFCGTLFCSCFNYTLLKAFNTLSPLSPIFKVELTSQM